MRSQKIELLGIVLLLTAMMTWASSFIALKSAIGPLGPMTVVFGRMVVASLCFVYFIKGFMKLEFTKKDIKYILLMTAFEPCLYFIFEAKALQLTTASQAGMITSMMPLMTAIGAGIALKEVITKIGYKHIGHFNKLFFDNVGISPSNYKKQLNNSSF